ncbi:hypothetical protein MTO96_041286 [Rhipicephalus appendiculatus]
MDFRLSNRRLGPKQWAQRLRAGLILLLGLMMLTTAALLLRWHHRSVPRDLQDGAGKSPHQITQPCNTVACRLVASLLNVSATYCPS